ncbi:MAG: hypothetical protein IPQ07_17920 [Myxococcales bacterium]|nr:hypothetical protein [Myxococcales bacterium]
MLTDPRHLRRHRRPDGGSCTYARTYLRFFESARAAYWRSLGRATRISRAWDRAPVVEAHCDYHKRPACYEDLLVVGVDVTELRPASVRFRGITCGVTPTLIAVGHAPRGDRHRWPPASGCRMRFAIRSRRS